MGGISSNGRNTVQGTFDDLSEEEKTRAYLQFLQYHQQLEQENETKRFQQMLNKNQGEENNEYDSKPSNDEKSIKDWNSLSHSSIPKPPSLAFILILLFFIA